jgi:hypothetical protein
MQMGDCFTVILSGSTAQLSVRRSNSEESP